MTEATGRYRQPWTTEEHDRMFSMRAAKVSWTKIAEALNRPEMSCRTIYCQLRGTERHADLARGEGTPSTKRPWTDADIAQMIHMREVERKKWSEIDLALNRAHGGSSQKYEGLRRPKTRPAPHLAGGRIDDAAALAARDAARGLAHQTLTAAFFGDPLPGRSVLDKRLRGEVDSAPPRSGIRAPAPITLAGGVS